MVLIDSAAPPHQYSGPLKSPSALLLANPSRIVTSGFRPVCRLTIINPASSSSRRARYSEYLDTPRSSNTELAKATVPLRLIPARNQRAIPTCRACPFSLAAFESHDMGIGPF